MDDFGKKGIRTDKVAAIFGWEFSEISKGPRNGPDARIIYDSERSVFINLLSDFHSDITSIVILVTLYFVNKGLAYTKIVVEDIAYAKSEIRVTLPPEKLRFRAGWNSGVLLSNISLIGLILLGIIAKPNSLSYRGSLHVVRAYAKIKSNKFVTLGYCASVFRFVNLLRNPTRRYRVSSAAAPGYTTSRIVWAAGGSTKEKERKASLSGTSI
jgi:hypothetical protein